MALQDNKMTGSSIHSDIIRKDTSAVVKKHVKIFVIDLAEKAAKFLSAFVEMT